MLTSKAPALLIHGSCHCGNITFELAWNPDPQEIRARACGCTFCSKHGGVWTSHPAGSLAIDVKNPSRVSRYSFGTGTAAFHVCAGCGIVPVVTSEIEGRTYAVVSVNAFDNVDPAIVRRDSVSHEGESVDARLARRKRNWIGEVRFSEGDG